MIKRFLSFRYLVLVIVICCGFLFFEKFASNITSYCEEKVAARGWTQYTSDDGQFSIAFPKEPKIASKKFDFPNEESIDLNEYKVEKEASFAVSYLNLPKKWRLFSSNTLLKGALNVVLKQLTGTELLEKKMIKYKNYPAMEFVLKEGENIIKGRLILVKETLYRLMVTDYPDTSHNKQQHEAFLDSFEPTPPQVN